MLAKQVTYLHIEVVDVCCIIIQWGGVVWVNAIDLEKSVFFYDLVFNYTYMNKLFCAIINLHFLWILQ